MATTLGIVAARHLNITYDLAHFLPKPTNETQRILTSRLGQGPGAQIIYVALPETTADETDAVAEQLRMLPGIRRVFPEAPPVGIATIPAVAWQHRFVLADLPDDEATWREVLSVRLVDADLADSDAAFDVIAGDPLLASVSALAHFAANAPSFEHDGERYLILHTTVPAFDIGGQSELVTSIRATLADTGLAHARLYGAGVYGVDLQASIRHEATVFSVLASIALACLLFWRFRSVATVVAIGMPMLAGAAAGLCALAFIHDQVHGIVLAFGFTLLGVVVDYPLHLYSHQSHPSAPRNVWPTLWIGIASTLFAYAAFLLGGTSGIEQLGLFAIVGTSGAALGAAWLMPPSISRPRLPHVANAHLKHGPWIVVFLLATPLVLLRSPFSDDLAALTPLPEKTLTADAELRRRMGSSDMGRVIVVRDTDRESALAATERLVRQLDATFSGTVDFTSIAPLLPSHARQQQRMTALRDFVAGGGIHDRSSAFATAVAQTPFAVSAFEPFQNAALAASDQADWLTYDDLAASPELAPLVSTHLLEIDGGWASLVFLRGMDTTTDAIAATIKPIGGAELVDLRSASQALLVSLRERLLAVLAFASAMVGGMLLLLTRSLSRTVWLVGTIAAAAAVTTGFGAWLHDGLSLFEIVALALVAGLGLDYGLFSSKAENNAPEAANTGRAVFICAASSVLVFGILAFSSTPALHRISTTVAVGVATAYILARLGRDSTSCA